MSLTQRRREEGEQREEGGEVEEVEETEEAKEGRTDRWVRTVERLTLSGRRISFYPPRPVECKAR
jgi:hypothetical protein